LASVVFGQTYKSDFIYDGWDRLRKRLDYTWTIPEGWQVSSETRYLYDGRRVIQERDSGNTPTVSYTRGIDLSGTLQRAGGIGGLLARSHAYQSGSGSWTNHNFYHADGGGNVTYMINSSQSVVASYRYDPFGNTISSSGSLASANVYRLSSKEVHVNSGMYYYTAFAFMIQTCNGGSTAIRLESGEGSICMGTSRNNPNNSNDPLGSWTAMQVTITFSVRIRTNGTKT